MTLPITSTSVLAPAPSPLSDSLALLDLLHHRNKNQHRPTQWFKHLSLLRRNIKHLLADQASIVHPRTSLIMEKKIRGRIEARELHLVQHIVPKCYGAFRLLATEGRFCALGLVLLGVLARIVRALPRPVSDKAVTAVDQVTMDPIWKASSAPSDATLLTDEDLGQKVERQEVVETKSGEAVSLIMKTQQQPTMSAKAEPRSKPGPTAAKKRPSKKSKNAIDDLFSGLS